MSVGRLSPEGGWTQGGVLARTLTSKGGGLGDSTLIGEGNKCLDCEIPHRLGKRTKHFYKGVETSI